MGDVAMLPHALRALREADPSVRITVLTRERFGPFFAGLDVALMDADFKTRYRGFAGLLRLTRDIRALQVDAVIDEHDVLRTKIVRTLLRLGGMRVTTLRKGRIEKWFRLGCSNPSARPLRHTVVRYCDALRRAGFEFEDPKPARRSPRPNPMGEKRGRWIGFAPFSAHAGKTCPEPLREAIVRTLSERFDRVFIHGGGGAEALFAERMEALYSNVTALWGKVGLAGELDLIANLDAVISMDSLAMHMAALVATPVVSIWGATHPALGFLGYGCDPEGIVQTDLPCRPCSVYGSRPCKRGDYRCLGALTAEQVIDRLEIVLAGGIR